MHYGRFNFYRHRLAIDLFPKQMLTLRLASSSTPRAAAQRRTLATVTFEGATVSSASSSNSVHVSSSHPASTSFSNDAQQERHSPGERKIFVNKKNVSHTLGCLWRQRMFRYQRFLRRETQHLCILRGIGQLNLEPTLIHLLTDRPKFQV